ncbi:MAG: pyrroline-5-carboxylate reductase [Microcystaceae cyanobacterium]
MSISLGIIGGGVMAEAILSRLLSTSLYQSETVVVSEPQEERRNFLAQTYQVNVTADNQAVFDQAPTVLLAIKPQILPMVVESLEMKNSPLIISILAGVTLSTLENSFINCPMIRVMPNTPATVGQGMTAIATGNMVTETQLTLAKGMFEAVGEVVIVPEKLMDGVTGLSGSGPAYVAIMIEALADGGVRAGLPRAIADQLALQTVLGTATLVAESGLHPAQLKDKVTSPGGTTIAGVSALEKARFRSALIEAVWAAKERSLELGKD